MTQTSEFVIETFLSEFETIAHKFSIIKETAESAVVSKQPYVWHPGVYVWIKGNQVIKVGRHLTNSRKRALEHLYFRDRIPFAFRNWKNKIEVEDYNFEDPSDITLLLFNVIEAKADNHWPAAVEIFMERMLEPQIRAKRTG